MDFTAILSYLAVSFPIIGTVLIALGGLVVAGATVVAITPSKSDDKYLESLEAKPIIGPLLKAIKAFSPIQKK